MYLEWFQDSGKRGVEDRKCKQCIAVFEEFCCKREQRNHTLSGGECRLERFVFLRWQIL